MTAPTGLALLRVEFKPNQINQLPKQMKREDQDKGKCERGSRYSADGVYCGGWHARSIHLDYVGHAALTDRFLDTDPNWSWEPVAFGPDGLPRFDDQGGLWIRLTLCGVTRLGYGDAQGKKGPNAVKEAIGDALRNAGMRFGAALDLWHKGDLHDAEEEQGKTVEEGFKEIARFESLIAGATTVAEMEAIRKEIASSEVTGAAREDLRTKFSARQAALLAVADGVQ